jgi:hypothetical protein
VIDSRFRDFVRSHQPLYDLTDARLRALVEKRASLSWFDRFFGVTPGARFVIVPGLGNGGGSYGLRFVPEKGPVEIWVIPGVSDVDAEGQPRFDEQMLPTLVHEFCHSYVNPIVDRYATKLDRSGPRIYDPVKDAMNRQAYSGWKTMFYESLVRVSTARYVLTYGGEKAALPVIRDELAHSFVWTAELFDLLGEYERSRDRYPTFDSFMPRIVDYFDGLAPRIDDMIRRYDESRPHVLSMSPANGSENVDPSLAEIVFLFDKPVVRQDRPSIVRQQEDTYPKVEGSRLDESGKVFIMRVRLEPSHLYEFSLNGPTGGSFKTEDAVRMKMYPVRFRTGATKH